MAIASPFHRTGSCQDLTFPVVGRWMLPTHYPSPTLCIAHLLRWPWLRLPPSSSRTGWFEIVRSPRCNCVSTFPFFRFRSFVRASLATYLTLLSISTLPGRRAGIYEFDNRHTAACPVSCATIGFPVLDFLLHYPKRSWTHRNGSLSTGFTRPCARHWNVHSKILLCSGSRKPDMA